MRVFKASIKAMAALQGAEIPVAHALVDVHDDQMDKIIRLFGEMQNEAAEHRRAYVKLPLSSLRGQHWVMVLSLIGLILLLAYLLWRLYARRPFSRVKLFAEISSTSKVVSLLVMKLPGAQMNYHMKATGKPRVVEQIGSKYQPQVVIEWAGLELIDRLSSLKYVPPSTCNLNPIYLKRLISIISLPHAIILKFRQGQEVTYIRSICESQCDGLTCRGESEGASNRWVRYPNLSSFDKIHQSFCPVGTWTGPVTEPLLLKEPVSPIRPCRFRLSPSMSDNGDYHQCGGNSLT